MSDKVALDTLARLLSQTVAPKRRIISARDRVYLGALVALAVIHAAFIVFVCIQWHTVIPLPFFIVTASMLAAGWWIGRDL